MELGKHWTIGRAKDYLEEQGFSIPMQTLRNWFNDLHEYKIHTLNRNERKERVLDEVDLEIAKYIYNARNENISVKALFPFIKERFAVQYREEESDSKALTYWDPDAIIAQMEELKKFFIEREEIIRKEIHEEYGRMLPDPKQQKLEMRIATLDVITAENKLRRRLEQEAEKEWEKNPVKTGLLFKKEDLLKKSEFIKNYVHDKIEEELKKEISNEVNE
jgi:hypothetical protein